MKFARPHRRAFSLSVKLNHKNEIFEKRLKLREKQQIF